MFPAIAMETEASQMLEAALEQMDDIIAGKFKVFRLDLCHLGALLKIHGLIVKKYEAIDMWTFPFYTEIRFIM